jgi:anaerobic magnesium-protoporphyrin IX monomethyl ester cyclase
VILGELEHTLLDVLRNAGPVPAGAAALVDGQLVYGPPRAPIACLDELPLPAWDLIAIEDYRQVWQNAHGYFSLNLVTSRGCPYRCNWCAKPIYGDTYRHLSPDRVAAELECVKFLFAPDEIWFADDIFGLSGRWTREFTNCVQQRDASIPFRIQSRCDLMTRDTVAALAQAGCREVWMGAESGSQRILDAMEKGTRVDQIRMARENLRQHGIRACYFLQFGYPGEAWEDVEATIGVVRATRPDDVGISVSYPLPNTRFHQIVQSGLGADAHWRDSADLRPLHQSAFSPEFYKALSEALHLEVRAGASEQVAAAWEEVEQLRCACC